MSKTNTVKCRICLTTKTDDNISDSSSYSKFFIQVLCLKEFNETLWLCMWCKASMKKALSLIMLAMASEELLRTESKRLHKMTYTHNLHTDIPPTHFISSDKQTNRTGNISERTAETLSPIHEIKNESEIQISKKQLKQEEIETTEVLESIESSNPIDKLVQNKIKIKNPNKRQLDVDELKFEVEYLNLEEQLKEVEMKKLKYKEFKFQCISCGMGFLTDDLFEEHKLRHAEQAGSYVCSICNLHFKSQDVLSQHLLAHKRRFKCYVCAAIFKRWSHCIAHRYKCGGVVTPSSCGECSKIFNNEHALRVHMKVHKAEKKYRCEQCDRAFASKQRLTVHLRCHSGIKPFSCADCDRSFATSSNLRAHLAVHSDSKYYCVECHTYYKTAKSLKRHFNESARHMTSDNLTYSCKECPKQFTTDKSLTQHVNTRHGTEHRCAQCDKTFSSNSNLNKHIKCIHNK